MSLAPVNPDWFYLLGNTFLVLAHPGSPGQSQRGHKMVVVEVVVSKSTWVKQTTNIGQVLNWKCYLCAIMCKMLCHKQNDTK